MAYNVTGTAGNDQLNYINDVGPGSIVGLAGDDTIISGRGSIYASGGSGRDFISAGGDVTGTVDGGSGDDYIACDAAEHSMLLLGGEGRDEFEVLNTTVSHTILGGNDSNDDADLIYSASGSDLVFGNGGNDTVIDAGGNNTVIGGFGSDLIKEGGGGFADLVFGNEGADTILVGAGNDTVFAGLGNDSMVAEYAPTDVARYFGNEGADTIALSGGTFTILGGNDSADGNDSLVSGGGADFIFGNGGADTIVSGPGNDTVVAGFTSDSVAADGGNNIIFGNEGDDTLAADVGPGASTVFAGLGNDWVRMAAGAGGGDNLQANEGNDTIFGGGGVDTMAGGDGGDLFIYYRDTSDDGSSTGAVELITDLNWAADRFQTFTPVAFAFDTGPRGGTTLAAAANDAIEEAFRRNSNRNENVAAQFAFNGRTYLAINQDPAYFMFDDTGDLLIDITGVSGTINTTNFI
jgi:Ca2+-binding RTX toxin-like protein